MIIEYYIDVILQFERRIVFNPDFHFLIRAKISIYILIFLIFAYVSLNSNHSIMFSGNYSIKWFGINGGWVERLTIWSFQIEFLKLELTQTNFP